MSEKDFKFDFDYNNNNNNNSVFNLNFMNNTSPHIICNNNNNINNNLQVEEKCIVGTIAVGKSTFINNYKKFINTSTKEFNYSTELLLKKPFKTYLNNREKYSDDFQLMMMMWSETRRIIMRRSMDKIILIERPIIENEIFALINYDNNNLSKEWLDNFYYPNYYALKKSFDKDNENRTYIFLFNSLIKCIARFKQRESTHNYPKEYFEKLYQYYFYFLIDLVVNIQKKIILLETNFELHTINEEFINNLKTLDKSLLIVKSLSNYKYNSFIRSKPSIQSIIFNRSIYDSSMKNLLNLNYNYNYNSSYFYYQVLLKLSKNFKVTITFN